MTIAAVSGSLVLPPVGKLEFDRSELSADLRAIPPGGLNLSASFTPAPTNNPDTTSKFNIFIASETFSGTVYMLRRPPPDAPPEMQKWFAATIRMLGGGGNIIPATWAVNAGDNLSGIAEEPENNVSYCVGMVGGTGKIYFRLSA